MTRREKELSKQLDEALSLCHQYEQKTNELIRAYDNERKIADEVMKHQAELIDLLKIKSQQYEEMINFLRKDQKHD